MKTAFEISGNAMVVISHDEFPEREWSETKGYNVVKLIKDNPELVEMKSEINSIQIIQIDGEIAKVFTLSFKDMKKIFECADAILKETPVPGNAKDYEPY
jgi:hypothetical protein